MSGQEQWPAERREALLVLWNAGESASNIGLSLGMTRNAVLGKLHRLRARLGKRVVAPRTTASPGAHKPKRRLAHPLRIREPVRVELGPVLERRRLAPMPPAIAVADGFIGPPAIFVRGGLDILELTHDTCRWPSADRPFRFCGAPVDGESGYCWFHRARARQWAG